MPDPSGSTDAFGTPTFKNGSGATLAGTTTGTRFLFTGREWLSQFGLYDYRNRTYSAAFGRFIEKDPIGFRAGDLNLYRYVSNNPVNLVDPMGLACGSGWNDLIVPDGDPLFGWRYDFTPACQQHDACYGKCGADKTECDKQFYTAMQNICKSQSPGADCYTQAGIYYLSVKLLGGPAFNAAQQKCCKDK